MAVCAVGSLDISCIWKLLASAALHVSRAFWRVRSASRSSRSLVRSSLLPKPILSLMIMSLWSPNSQVAALVRRSVTHWSTVSPFNCAEAVAFEHHVSSWLAIGPESCQDAVQCHVLILHVQCKGVEYF